MWPPARDVGCRDVGHHPLVAVAKKELVAVVRPDRFRPSSRRHLVFRFQPWNRADPSFSSSPTRNLFQTTFVDTFGVSWDLAPDGRFLVIKPSADDSDPSELRIVLNWFEELERLVPTN